MSAGNGLPVLFYTSCGAVQLVSPFWTQVVKGNWEVVGSAPAKHASLVPSSRQICSASWTWVSSAGFLNAARIIIRNWKNTSTPCYRGGGSSSWQLHMSWNWFCYYITVIWVLMYVMWDVLRCQEGRFFLKYHTVLFVPCLWLITATCRVVREMYVLYYVAGWLKRNHKMSCCLGGWESQTGLSSTEGWINTLWGFPLSLGCVDSKKNVNKKTPINWQKSSWHLCHSQQ